MQTKYGYFFIEAPFKRPGYITVAITRPDKEDPDQKHLASFSFCSPKDHFNKKIGRAIATGRLKTDRVITLNLAGSVSEVVKEALNQAVMINQVPSWVRKAYLRGRIGFGLNRNPQLVVI